MAASSGGGAVRRPSVLGQGPKTLMPAEFISAEQIKSMGSQRDHGPVGAGRQGALGAPDPSGGAVQVSSVHKGPRQPPGAFAFRAAASWGGAVPTRWNRTGSRQLRVCRAVLQQALHPALRRGGAETVRSNVGPFGKIMDFPLRYTKKDCKNESGCGIFLASANSAPALSPQIAVSAGVL